MFSLIINDDVAIQSTNKVKNFNEFILQANYFVIVSFNSLHTWGTFNSLHFFLCVEINNNNHRLFLTSKHHLFYDDQFLTFVLLKDPQVTLMLHDKLDMVPLMCSIQYVSEFRLTGALHFQINA